MAPRVQDITVTPALFVDPLLSVARAATLLSERQMEGLLVADEDGWYGIVTTADIREKALFAHQDPDMITVRDIMMPCPPTANPVWPVASCVSLMDTLGTRCLPVADQEGFIICLVAPTESADSVKYPPHGDVYDPKGRR